MAARFRCCYCRTENEREFDKHEQLAGLHKKKTMKVRCSRCGDDTLQNKLGA